MTRGVRAIISWIPPEKGGRRPPKGPRYSTVARFEDDPQWPHQAWSLVVEIDRWFGSGKYVLSKINFLVDEGPHQLLDAGNRFELLEGAKRVAKGIVLPAEVEVPSDLNSFDAASIG